MIQDVSNKPIPSPRKRNLMHKIIHVPVDISCFNMNFCELAINYNKEKQPQK